MSSEELKVHMEARAAAKEECRRISVELHQIDELVSKLHADYKAASKTFEKHDRLIAEHEQRFHLIPPKRSGRRVQIITEVQLDPSKLSIEQASSLLQQLSKKLGINLCTDSE